MKKYYDMKVKPKQFQAGTWVWYHNPRRYVGHSSKLARHFTGPYLITKVLDPVNVVLQLSQRSKQLVTHINKLQLCLGDTPRNWLTGHGNTRESTAVPEGTTVRDLDVTEFESRELSDISEKEVGEPTQEVLSEAVDPPMDLPPRRSGITRRSPNRNPDEGYAGRRVMTHPMEDIVMPGQTSYGH